MTDHWRVKEKRCRRTRSEWYCRRQRSINCTQSFLTKFWWILVSDCFSGLSDSTCVREVQKQSWKFRKELNKWKKPPRNKQGWHVGTRRFSDRVRGREKGWHAGTWNWSQDSDCGGTVCGRAEKQLCVQKTNAFCSNSTWHISEPCPLSGGHSINSLL